MNRTAWLLDRLIELSGPLGPFTTPQQREQQHEHFLAGLDESTLDPLIGILVRPSPEVPNDAYREHFELELQEAIVAAGRNCPLVALNKIAPLLEDAVARPVAIDVIGALRLREGIPLLERQSEHEPSTADEWARIACALGDIGGTAADIVLARMQSHPQARAPEIAEAILIARMRCESSKG